MHSTVQNQTVIAVVLRGAQWTNAHAILPCSLLTACHEFVCGWVFHAFVCVCLRAGQDQIFISEVPDGSAGSSQPLVSLSEFQIHCCSWNIYSRYKHVLNGQELAAGGLLLKQGAVAILEDIFCCA